MVNVRMAQDQILYFSRIERKVFIVERHLRFSSLKLSAIQQHFVVFGRD